jgi:hypothetical protein
MDYTKVPRILIYKERSSLDDFGVYEPKSFNAILYESLMTLEDLKPWIKGAFHEILRLFNDAYYYLTLIFLEKNPLERYPDYCYNFGECPQGYDFDFASENRETVLKSMLFVMLRTFGKNLPAPQQHLLTAMVADINERTSIKDVGTALKRIRGEEEDIAYKITCNFEFNIMQGSIPNKNCSRRDIQELLDSGVSLKECLSAGKILREAVNILCESKEQKLVLIERLLEPEKEGYGCLDMKVTESYRCLYELCSELTGEPLPEKLPFERNAEALGTPVIQQYSPNVSLQSSRMLNPNFDSDKELVLGQIDDLKEEVNQLAREKAALENSNLELLEMANLSKSNIVIADDRKIDVIKVLHAMCKIGLFKTKDGSKFTIKAVMEFFGRILNDNFSEYSSNLSTSKSTAKNDTFLEIFDKLRDEAKKYLNKS